MRIEQPGVTAFTELSDVPHTYSTFGGDLLKVKVTEDGIEFGPGGGGGGVNSVVAGTGIAVDNTDPANPVVSTTGDGGGVTLTQVEVNLGSTPKNSGSFTISSSGLTPGKSVLINQASGPYTGKGTLADEAEMDGLTVSGTTTNSTTIQCYWSCATSVRSNFKFNYQVSA